MGAVPSGAVGTTTVKPPSTAVALIIQLAVYLIVDQSLNLRCKDRSSDSDERSVDLARPIGSLNDRVGSQESDGLSSSDVAVLGR